MEQRKYPRTPAQKEIDRLDPRAEVSDILKEAGTMLNKGVWAVVVGDHTGWVFRDGPESPTSKKDERDALSLAIRLEQATLKNAVWEMLKARYEKAQPRVSRSKARAA